VLGECLARELRRLGSVVAEGPSATPPGGAGDARR
jgi:hypothetical protein